MNRANAKTEGRVSQDSVLNLLASVLLISLVSCVNLMSMNVRSIMVLLRDVRIMEHVSINEEDSIVSANLATMDLFVSITCQHAQKLSSCVAHMVIVLRILLIPPVLLLEKPTPTNVFVIGDSKFQVTRTIQLALTLMNANLILAILESIVSIYPDHLSVQDARMVIKVSRTWNNFRNSSFQKKEMLVLMLMNVLENVKCALHL